MKTSSAKAKGRRLQDEVAVKILETYNESFRAYEIEREDAITMPTLEQGDVKPAIMGETGTDIKLSPQAKKHIPFDIECKNQERLNLWESIKQTESNAEAGRTPLLIFKRNRSEVYCVLKFEDLLKLI